MITWILKFVVTFRILSVTMFKILLCWSLFIFHWILCQDIAFPTYPRFKSTTYPPSTTVLLVRIILMKNIHSWRGFTLFKTWFIALFQEFYDELYNLTVSERTWLKITLLWARLCVKIKKHVFYNESLSEKNDRKT